MAIVDKLLNIDQVAIKLGISNASVRNWITHGYLNPIKIDNKVFYKHEDVRKLKSDISNGNINRLTSRANKKKASRSFIPEEYLLNKDNSILIETIVNYIIDNKLDISTSLYLLSISFGIIEDVLILQKTEKKVNIFDFKAYSILIKQLEKELYNWFNSIKNNLKLEKYKDLLDFELPNEIDILGIIYQSIMLEGEKAVKGSYYTPNFIAEEVINDYLNERHKILDPCCGTGQFLLTAARIIKDPKNIYGIDIDSIAVRIARINLIVAYKTTDFVPKIYNNNVLLDFNSDNLFGNDKLGNFDLIITNPPWGLHFSKSDLENLKEIYPEIISQESYSYILNKCINLLNENGNLSFILPESILNVKVHKDIRKIILTNTHIKKIKFLNRVFTNVFTPVIRIDLNNPVQLDDNNEIKITTETVSYQICQIKYKNNQDYIFNIHASKIDQEIIKRVYNFEHVTLKNNADWALGIVTGNNGKYIKSEPEPDLEPIYTGKDVKKYNLCIASKYINYEPNNFQQVAPIQKYRSSEKLIYKFISKNLIFAYDNKQVLTLNSANIIIPEIKNYPIKIILALFNSELYQFLYQKLFASIKILRSQLEALPLPIFTKNQENLILNMVNDVLQNKKSEEMIDKFLFDFFSITDEERKYINKMVK